MSLSIQIGKGFSVIDKKTGRAPDMRNIAQHEDWAYGLCYTNLLGFALTEDGELIFMDSCGNYCYCPSDRFEIKEQNEFEITPELRVTIAEAVRRAVAEYEKNAKEKAEGDKEGV
jgi:hypothetical protein